MEPMTNSILVKLTDADREDLELLAAEWRSTRAEAIRRAIRETLKREQTK